MRFRDVPDILLAALLVFGVALLSSSRSAAGESYGEKVEGVYEAAQSKSEARKAIDGELEKVIGKMFIVKRPFARSQLRDGTEPCSEMTFAYEKSKISIRCDDLNPAVSKPDGSKTTYTEADGTSHKLSQTVEEDRIVQKFISDNGTRTNTYRLADDDTLVMDVKLESSQLPEAITYRRKFKRK